MALMDFIKKQFVDVIEWNETTDGVLAWRFPFQDNEIQNGAQLVVRESQVALFVNEGKVADLFGPGTHTLTTGGVDNSVFNGSLGGDGGLVKQGTGSLTLAGTNQLELRVFANEQYRQAVAVARLDNLGKGASGAAVQNLQLMLGV